MGAHRAVHVLHDCGGRIDRNPISRSPMACSHLVPPSAALHPEKKRTVPAGRRRPRSWGGEVEESQGEGSGGEVEERLEEGCGGEVEESQRQNLGKEGVAGWATLEMEGTNW